MQDIIELTPQLLLEQSQEMQSLCTAYENLFANISSDLTGVNESWSDLLANNFSGKIGSAQKTFSGALTMLGNVAAGTRNVAETIQETDAEWASKIGGALSAIFSMSSTEVETTQSAPQTSPVNVASYCDKVTHTEYAKLCQLWQEADRACDKSADTTLAGTYAALLRNNLSENDPLHNISEEQIQVTRYSSGLSAAVIGNGDQALVIFAGTDFSKENDLLADAALVAGIESDQEKEAKALVDSLSKEYSNIVVTGHSLGGYLATAATLDNDVVSECVAFDPPGRKDRDEHLLFNNKQYSKVTTYKAVGSPVSSYVAGNREIGKVVPVFVSMENNLGNHGIKQICDALGGEEKIRETWDNA